MFGAGIGAVFNDFKTPDIEDGLSHNAGTDKSYFPIIFLQKNGSAGSISAPPFFYYIL